MATTNPLEAPTAAGARLLPHATCSPSLLEALAGHSRLALQHLAAPRSTDRGRRAAPLASRSPSKHRPWQTRGSPHAPCGISQPLEAPTVADARLPSRALWHLAAPRSTDRGRRAAPLTRPVASRSPSKHRPWQTRGSPHAPCGISQPLEAPNVADARAPLTRPVASRSPSKHRPWQTRGSPHAPCGISQPLEAPTVVDARLPSPSRALWHLAAPRSTDRGRRAAPLTRPVASRSPSKHRPW